MTDAMFSQLVENIRRDGCLTSVPLVYDDGGKLEVFVRHRNIWDIWALFLNGGSGSS